MFQLPTKYLKYGVLRKMQMVEILINEYHIWMIVHCFHSDACVATSHQDSLNQAGWDKSPDVFMSHMQLAVYVLFQG